MAIVFNNTVYPAGYLGTDDGAAKATVNIDDASTYSVSVTGTVNAAGDTVMLTYGADAPAGYAGTTVQLTASAFDNAGMIEFTSTAIPPGNTKAQTYRYILSNTQVYGSTPPAGQTRTTFTADSDGTPTDYVVAPPAVCFVSGTSIRVVRDGIVREARVEDLRVGDLAVTASGALRPIIWTGHREIECRNHGFRQNVLPIRVAAHAFGTDLPMRDLYLSPGHPVLVGADADNEGGRLVPIMCLVNGTTIERMSVDEVTYWHVELDAHDILLAEGLPAESYLDWGDRVFFSEADQHGLANPDFIVPGLAGRCRPVAVDGPVVEAERLRLDAVFATRLEAAGAWPTEDVASSVW